MGKVLATVKIHASSKELGAVFFQVSIPSAPFVLAKTFDHWSLVEEYCDYWKVATDPELRVLLLDHFTFCDKRGWSLNKKDYDDGFLGVMKHLKTIQSDLI